MAVADAVFLLQDATVLSHIVSEFDRCVALAFEGLGEFKTNPLAISGRLDQILACVGVHVAAVRIRLRRVALAGDRGVSDRSAFERVGEFDWLGHLSPNDPIVQHAHRIVFRDLSADDLHWLRRFWFSVHRLVF